MSITVWVIENILYGLMRPATSIAAATALMAAFALSPLMAVSSKKRGAQAPLFFVGKMPIHKKPLFRQGYGHICVSSEYVLPVGFVFNCSFRNTIFSAYLIRDRRNLISCDILVMRGSPFRFFVCGDSNIT